jgi:hypothetical protein
MRTTESIVQTFTSAGFPGGVPLARPVPAELHDGSTRATSTSLVDSFDAGDAMLSLGTEVGSRADHECLDGRLVVAAGAGHAS